MPLSSPYVSFDDRLLAVEELFRQRQNARASEELAKLQVSDFDASPPEHGLYLLLAANAQYNQANYVKALEFGHHAAKLLADYPLHRRYGWVLLILSKSYSALGDMKNAEIRARDALASFRRAADDIGQVDSLNELARIASVRCEYTVGIDYLSEALAMVSSDKRKVAQLTGNRGTLRVCTGDWAKAECELTEALEYNSVNGQELSQVVNLLSLAYLRLRRRQFRLARRHLDDALEVITRHDLKREKVLYLKFAGELALEKGDLFRAKSSLSDAYHKGILLAPSSALISQASRRLAEAELSLDNADEAMRWAQKGLELSLTVGEKVEIGLSRKVIAQVFAVNNDGDEAIQNIDLAVQTLREVNDPYELARTLLVQADIYARFVEVDRGKIKSSLEDALFLFRSLGLDYWVAETEYKAGVFACQSGNLAAGFKFLSKAEKGFVDNGDAASVKKVNKFLQSLSDQAVALSISGENEFKVFGNLVSPSELSEVQSGQMEEILEMLLKKTSASRALLISMIGTDPLVVASFRWTQPQIKRFMAGFRELLGQEFSKTRPTLLLDCRRDPFINDLFPDIPVVVTSLIVVPFNLGDEETCYLYLDRMSEVNRLNPFNQDELNFAVGFSDLVGFKWAAYQKHCLLEDNERLKHQLMEKAAFPNIITQNADMHELLSQIRQVVNSNISVLIEGETGVGKDLLARAIHFNSRRREKRFISVNCAALPETLLESELFGYKRGAFTGADRDKTGLIEEADGGTFFLDEIADMPLSIQAKLLRVLESQELVRLGETVPRKVDVRIVSATNRNLKIAMKDGQFRQDLYYRLTALTFYVPALRERRDDIPLLITNFLEGTNKVVSPEVMKRLVAYDWPGNIRELQNEIKKLVLMAGENKEIKFTSLASHLAPSAPENGHQITTVVMTSATDLDFSMEYSLYDYLSGLERRYIERALRESGGVKKHAAAKLNIPESTLRLKIKQYGIRVDDFVFELPPEFSYCHLLTTSY